MGIQEEKHKLKYIKNANFNGGAIREDGYKFLVTLCKLNNFKQILEFGPGASTWAFLETNPNIICSCENQFKWYDHYFEQFKYFPKILLYKYSNKPEKEYTIDLLDQCQFDFAFVDSPLGTKTMSRWRSMEYCIKATDIICLHDCYRPGEKETLEWMKKQGFKVKNINIGIGFGLCYKTNIKVPTKNEVREFCIS